MVDLNGIKGKYNLTVNMSRNVGTALVAIGVDDALNDETITFFDRNQVLSGGLDKYPVLRGIHINPAIAPNWEANIVASGLAGIEAVSTIYHGTDIDNDEILAQCSVALYRDVLGAEEAYAIAMNTCERNFMGGILLPDQVLIRVTIVTDVNVAAADLAAAQVAFINMFEIDWVPITKKELTETVVEQVYAEQ